MTIGKSVAVIALAFALMNPELALAGPWATDAELEENERKVRAWELYRTGLEQRNPGLAIEQFLSARTLHRAAGPLTIFKVKKIRQGVRTRYQFFDERRHEWRPEELIGERFATLVKATKARVGGLPGARTKTEVEGAFSTAARILESMKRHELPGAILIQAQDALEKSQAALTKKHPVVPPAKPRKPAIPEKTGDGKPPRESAQARLERRRIAAELVRLRRAALSAKLRGHEETSRRALAQGELAAAVAAISSASPLLRELRAGTEGLEPAELAALSGRGEVFKALAQGEAAMASFVGLIGKRSSPEKDAATIAAGIAASRRVGAMLWCRQIQQRLAFQFVRQGGGRPRPLVRRMRSLEEPLARQILKIAAGRMVLREALGRDSSEALPRVSGRTRAIAIAIRGRVRVEEAWEERQRTDSIEARAESIEDLGRVLRLLDDAMKWRLPKSIRGQVSGARGAVIRELVAAPRALLSDRGAAVERVAGLLVSLAELEDRLRSESFYRALWGAGYAALDRMRDPSCDWIIEEAVAHRPELAGRRPEGFPRALTEAYEARHR